MCLKLYRICRVSQILIEMIEKIETYRNVSTLQGKVDFSELSVNLWKKLGRCTGFTWYTRCTRCSPNVILETLRLRSARLFKFITNFWSFRKIWQFFVFVYIRKKRYFFRQHHATSLVKLNENKKLPKKTCQISRR